MKRKELTILLGLVLFDLATKLAANFFLPLNEFVDIVGQSISFFLTYNEGSTGSQADTMIQPEFNKNLLVILSSINGLILLMYSLLIRIKKIPLSLKVVIGIILFILLTISMNFTYPLFWNANISSWTASVIGKLTGISIYGSIFYFSKDKWVRLFILIVLSCGIGNLLSHFYPPYFIIDFIYIEGSYEFLRIGVFNFADLAFDIGLIGFILSLIIKLVRKIANENRQVPRVEQTIRDRQTSS